MATNRLIPGNSIPRRLPTNDAFAHLLIYDPAELFDGRGTRYGMSLRGTSTDEYAYLVARSYAIASLYTPDREITVVNYSKTANSERVYPNAGLDEGMSDYSITVRYDFSSLDTPRIGPYYYKIAIVAMDDPGQNLVHLGEYTSEMFIVCN